MVSMNPLKLEIAWTLAIVAILTGVTVASAFILSQDVALSPNVNEYVDVTGYQFEWQFCYSNSTCVEPIWNPSTSTTSGGAFWASPGALVQINVTGGDVIHSFNIPALGVRIDAIPGRMNYYQFNIPTVAVGSEYLIQCTEFCGAGHGTMRAYLVVV